MKLENDLWHYALRLYGQPGVESACLELQKTGLSINRLLFCLWLGQDAGRQLDLTVLQGATDWQSEITHPLRALRYKVRTYKQQDETYQACYSAMRKAELACEQLELALMYDVAEQMLKGEAGSSLVLENLAGYLNGCTLNAAPSVTAAFEPLLQAALPEVPEDWQQILSLPVE